ncbi:succinate semialdehyde dehydrogenase [Sistotremastrum niveocremeum HHB9708]|uniref:Succinate semialdehyde dehydrogenase n=1 Tax=Sistotremastrum niveocremeum HHB9708 TaxID=1314777 RepID=A0A164WT33_9AGAM|nr:succinate semialdehyde dehydrogenase [Sistotremastrum niveocremeum HHB9708]
MSFSSVVQTTITPHSQKPLTERNYPKESEVSDAIQRAAKAQKEWKNVALKDRIKIAERFTEEFKKMENEIPLELTLQMGRPVAQNAGEIRGTLERAKYMISIAESSLADVPLTDTDKPGFRRYIRREAVGVVLIIAPWNFPYLTSINSVLPALIAGNAVILKPSPQTPLTGERFAQAFYNAGLPKDLLITLHLTPELTQYAVQHPLVNFVSFTGSVAGGRAVERAAAQAKTIKGVALELGGKDPAYVRPDADLQYSVAELVDGAFFNAGQSCCAVERIYVHDSLYDDFVREYAQQVQNYKLGDPTTEGINLGPVVSVASANRIRKQVADAVSQGAKPLIAEDKFPQATPGSAFVAPQVLVDVNHTMEVMTEETFGPVVGIQKVSSDEEALKLMNDSPYGLTASIWSKSAPDSLVENLEFGTVFLNRCDYLDPALAWTGVKDSGRGISLSKFGYDQLTRAKSVHLKSLNP